MRLEAMNETFTERYNGCKVPCSFSIRFIRVYCLLKECVSCRHLTRDVSEYLSIFVKLLLHLLKIVTVFILQEYLRGGEAGGGGSWGGEIHYTGGTGQGADTYRQEQPQERQNIQVRQGAQEQRAQQGGTQELPGGGVSPTRRTDTCVRGRNQVRVLVSLGNASVTNASRLLGL